MSTLPCPTCGRRVLLGTRRLVRLALVLVAGLGAYAGAALWWF